MWLVKVCVVYLIFIILIVSFVSLLGCSSMNITPEECKARGCILIVAPDRSLDSHIRPTDDF